MTLKEAFEALKAEHPNRLITATECLYHFASNRVDCYVHLHVGSEASIKHAVVADTPQKAFDLMVEKLEQEREEQEAAKWHKREDGLEVDAEGNLKSLSHWEKPLVSADDVDRT